MEHRYVYTQLYIFYEEFVAFAKDSTVAFARIRESELYNMQRQGYAAWLTTRRTNHKLGQLLRLRGFFHADNRVCDPACGICIDSKLSN